MSTTTAEAPPTYSIELSTPHEIAATLQAKHSTPERPFEFTEAAATYTAARENLAILGHRIGSSIHFTDTEAGAIITEANRLITANA